MGAKGDPKTGGRKKGSKTKRTIILQEYFDKNKIFIPDKVIDLIKNGVMDDKDKAKLWMDLMNYIYPKKSAVTVDGDIGMTGHDAFLAAIEDARKKNDS